MKYGIQLYSLRQYLKTDEDYREVFKRCKEMGAETVQLSVTAGHPYNAELIKELVKESGLSICSTHSPYSRIVNDLDNLALEHLSFDCHEIGIGMMPGEYRKNHYEKLDEFISELNRAAERLKQYNICIAYHNHWFEWDDTPNGKVIEKLIKDTSKDVHFIPDTFWIKFAGAEPVEFLKTVRGRIQTLHLKDYKKTLGLPIFRAVGKGILDFKEIIKTAEDMGVQNSVVELDLSPNPYKSLEFSFDYINKNLK